MKKYKQISVFWLSFLILILTSCASTTYYTKALFNRSNVRRVNPKDTDKKSGYILMQKLFKTKPGKTTKEYVDKNGYPDYFFTPESPFTPMLIYIKKNLCTTFRCSIFFKVSLDEEKEIPLFLYDYFTQEEREELQKITKNKLKAKSKTRHTEEGKK